MKKILSHFLLGESDDEVARVIDDRLTADNARLLIEAQEKRMGHSEVMYEKARALKEASDEQRLQPRYVEAFFKQAMNALGGVVEEVESVIFQVKVMPSQVQHELRTEFSITETYSQHHICFDKRVFLEYTARERYDGLEFINPGNKLFDALCRVVQHECQSDVPGVHALSIRKRLEGIWRGWWNPSSRTGAAREVWPMRKFVSSTTRKDREHFIRHHRSWICGRP